MPYRRRTEHHRGERDSEIKMREMQVSGLCGAKAEFTIGQDLEMAHRVVSGLESLPKRIGRER
jgi:hypothetical protein